jgi:rod shape determining protein RodA
MPIREQIKLLRRMDPWVTGAMIAMAAISILFIYSATYRGEGKPMPDFYRQQVVWFAIGLGLYLVAAMVDYRLICQWATLWYVLAVALLLMVLMVGVRVNGSKSWLGWGRFGIQPVEFAKLALIVAVSYFLFHRSAEARQQWGTVGGTLVLLAMPAALILMQPDLGSTLVLGPICVGLMFVSGVRVRHLVTLALAGMLLLPLAWSQLKPYQRSRLTVFVNPDRDPLGAGWNLNQSMIAVGSGGFSGKGYLQGTQNLLGYLPRSVAPNDFLFSVIGEEKGFLGTVTVLGLYAVLLFAGLRIAAHARDRLGMLLATGVVAMLFFHVFINVGMTIGLMPITGLPLPLLSYGGSFVLASMTALGLLQNVWIHRRIY